MAKRYVLYGTLAFSLFLVGGMVLFLSTKGTNREDIDTMQKPFERVYAERDKRIFHSTIAGTWYAGDRNTLTEDIQDHMSRANVPVLDTILALILPHAGYRYSGDVAAFGAKAIQGKPYERIIVMGPSHRAYLHNKAHVSSATHFNTPFGEVPLDLDAIATLLKHQEFQSVEGVDDAEHSVQIMIPFLQFTVSDFKLVPIIVGQFDLESAKRAAKALRSITTPTTLVVVSSDFTHYGANFGYVPFKNNIPENLKRLDMGAWEYIEKKDAEGFAAYVEQTGATICGRNPILILLSMLPQESKAHLLNYDTSGNILDDYHSSVSYLSAAFTGQWTPAEHIAADTASTKSQLSEEDKVQLLKLARGMLETYVKTGKRTTPEALGITITPAMSQNMGAFVTLTINENLRGCIGEIVPRRPLYQAVMDHAINAGAHDMRFMPITEKELPLLHYEISALTPPRPVASYKDIVIGKHGMVIEKNGRSAVFLPQVAVEQHWDLDQTLTHLSLKAGLPADAWKEGAQWTVFEAIVFSEPK